MEDIGTLIKALILLGGIIFLIVLLTWILKKINMMGARIGKVGDAPRLEVREAVQVDHRRRLVLVRRDHVEHLVMIGGENDFLVEHHIMPPMPAQPSAQPPVQQPMQATPQPAPQSAPLAPRSAAPQPAPQRPQPTAQPVPPQRPTPQQAPHLPAQPKPMARPTEAAKGTAPAIKVSDGAQTRSTTPTVDVANNKPSASIQTPSQPQPARWQNDLTATMPPHPLKPKDAASSREETKPAEPKPAEQSAQSVRSNQPAPAATEPKAASIGKATEQGTAPILTQPKPGQPEASQPETHQRQSAAKDQLPSSDKPDPADKNEKGQPSVDPVQDSTTAPKEQSTAPEQSKPDADLLAVKADKDPGTTAPVAAAPEDSAQEASKPDAPQQAAPTQEEAKPTQSKQPPASSAYDDEINRLLNELSGDFKK
ncbi:flagellar biosynthetic protein FliO [Cohaesibacter sp. CAU 1516]|uniref:flagellar biosynthetic protein FliO n=1 Tax=Cohaesibacter sp. CAU 1516 TaxID=2576038 RepID=UPI0014855205|nr:flagellar biosynthetic protein FliO [Cohaesibacter sp. CAU 1516]